MHHCLRLLRSLGISGMSRRATLFVLALLSATKACAHPEIQDALDRLTTALAATPNDASLYAERGELYAQHEDWLSAEANYMRAAELAPGLPRLARARGSLALARGQVSAARRFLDHAIALAPSDPTAFILRARALARLGLTPDALADYTQAFGLLAAPSPELYLERAALFASPADALRSLADAFVRLGPVMSLQLRALDLEISLSRFDDALTRVDLLTSASERRELWLKRRGDILVSAGRQAEARATYVAAQTAIAALPAWLAASPDTVRLSTELTRLATTSP